MKWYHLEGQRFGMLTVLKAGESKKTTFGTRKYWICKCDCGKTMQTLSACLIKGKTKSCGCLRSIEGKKRIGPLHPNWKGGIITVDGYQKSWDNKKQVYLMKHRLVMEQFLKRPLGRTEVVHHKNGDRGDNRIENLELWDNSHPDGQRISEKVLWCIHFLLKHAPEYIRNKKMIEALYPIKIEEA